MPRTIHPTITYRRNALFPKNANAVLLYGASQRRLNRRPEKSSQNPSNASHNQFQSPIPTTPVL